MKELLKSILIGILVVESRILLRRHKPTIVAITGSVGKTSTKDAIFAVLKDRIHARKSEKNYNTDLSVALTVLGLRNAGHNPWLWTKNIFDGLLHALFIHDYPKVLVLELGVDRPGDMKKLTRFIKPDVVVLTRLPDVPSHVEFFSSPQEVTDEKLQLVWALKKDGVLVYNHDDEKVREAAQEVRQQSFGYSRYSPSHFTASGDTIVYDGALPEGLSFTLTHVKESVTVRVRGSIGVQQTYNYAAACAVGSIFGISLTDAAHALDAFTPPPGRMKLIRGIKNTLIIDDTYNSSPTASARAIQTLSELKGFSRKIAVLGDMLELGQYSVREHERIGEQAALTVDMLVTIGVRARKIAEGALEHGLSEKNIFQYDDPARAGAELRQMLQKGDVLLVKGSQFVRSERVVKAVMADPEHAQELLVRQEEFWK